MTDDFDVPTLVRAYQDGLYTSGELVAKVLDLSDTASLDDLTANLPDSLRDAFVRSARQLYDNDQPAEAFKALHSAGHIPARRLAMLRAWLSRQSRTRS